MYLEDLGTTNKEIIMISIRQKSDKGTTYVGLTDEEYIKIKDLISSDSTISVIRVIDMPTTKAEVIALHK